MGVSIDFPRYFRKTIIQRQQLRQFFNSSRLWFYIFRTISPDLLLITIKYSRYMLHSRLKLIEVLMNNIQWDFLLSYISLYLYFDLHNIYLWEKQTKLLFHRYFKLHFAIHDFTIVNISDCEHYCLYTYAALRKCYYHR